MSDQLDKQGYISFPSLAVDENSLIEEARHVGNDVTPLDALIPTEELHHGIELNSRKPAMSGAE